MENRSISGQYPPGSTYKPVVAAAALEEGLITPRRHPSSVNGTFTMDSRTSLLQAERVMASKPSPGDRGVLRRLFLQPGQTARVDKIAAAAHAFGLGAPLGIDLERREGGWIPRSSGTLSLREPCRPAKPSPSPSAGFDLVTPLQLAHVYANPWGTAAPCTGHGS